MDVWALSISNMLQPFHLSICFNVFLQKHVFFPFNPCPMPSAVSSVRPISIKDFEASRRPWVRPFHHPRLGRRRFLNWQRERAVNMGKYRMMVKYRDGYGVVWKWGLTGWWPFLAGKLVIIHWCFVWLLSVLSSGVHWCPFLVAWAPQLSWCTSPTRSSSPVACVSCYIYSSWFISTADPQISFFFLLFFQNPDFLKKKTHMVFWVPMFPHYSWQPFGICCGMIIVFFLPLSP